MVREEQRHSPRSHKKIRKKNPASSVDFRTRNSEALPQIRWANSFRVHLRILRSPRQCRHYQSEIAVSRRLEADDTMLTGGGSTGRPGVCDGATAATHEAGFLRAELTSSLSRCANWRRERETMVYAIFRSFVPPFQRQCFVAGCDEVC